MNFRIHLSIVAIFFLLFQLTLHAQPLPEPLNKNRFEAGYTHYWYEGYFYGNSANQSREELWTAGSLYFRAGLDCTGLYEGEI